MVDLKKLIAGFLVLAAAASSVALVFIGYSSPENQKSGSENAAADAANSVPQNAFVEPVAETNGNPFAVQTIENDKATLEAKLNQPITYSTNLTENFALEFSHEFVSQNPNGPKLDASGNPVGINMPQKTAIEKALADAMKEVKSEFNAKPAPVRVNVNYTDEDIRAYGASSKGSVEKAITKINLALRTLGDPAAAGANGDPLQPSAEDTGKILGAVSDTRKAFEGAYADLAGLVVPAPMEKLHTSALVFAEHQKKTMEFVESYQSDPLKAYAAIKIAGKVLDQDTKNVQGEMQRLAASGILNNIAFKEKPSLLSFVNDLLGIRTAHAQYGLEDSTAYVKLPVHIADLIKVIDTWLNSVLIGPLLRSIMNSIWNGVLNWIRNGTTPYFITNWRSFLEQAGQQAIGLYIGKYAPNLCKNLGPLVQISLNNAFLPSTLQQSSICTLDRLVANISGFYQNFQNGGWLAYGATILPSGNYFGELLLSDEQLAAKRAEERSAAQSRGVAGKGFHPFTVCPQTATLIPGSAGWAYPCKDIATGEAVAGEDGTPGSAIAQRLFIAENADPERLANVRRFSELVGALFDAAITRLSKSIL